jgi:hypothetical protein
MVTRGEQECPTLGSARRDCDGSMPYAKRETAPKVRLEPKKSKRHTSARAANDSDVAPRALRTI